MAGAINKRFDPLEKTVLRTLNQIVYTVYLKEAGTKKIKYKIFSSDKDAVLASANNILNSDSKLQLVAEAPYVDLLPGGPNKDYTEVQIEEL